MKITDGSGVKNRELWKGCLFEINILLGMSITDIVKSILNHITDLLNRPVRECLVDYE